MIYFTADTHFGHANIVKMCQRPYPDVDAMNEAMIAAWNERVQGNDTVYIIGDMFFRCADPESILKRLKGRKRLIVGNHDGSWMGKVDLSRDHVLNAGVDVNGYRPVTFDELVENNCQFKTAHAGK